LHNSKILFDELISDRNIGFVEQ